MTHRSPEIYLDNAATTAVLPLVKEEMDRMFTAEYGNPSSMHRKGALAEECVSAAKKLLAGTLFAKEKELIFTSGGTEGNNIAILGAASARARKGRHIITTKTEHASVYNVIEHLKKQGCEVDYVPADKTGLVKTEDVLGLLRPDTVLVSVMMVNNEIGTRQDVEKIGEALKAADADVLFHVDAVQGYGKYRIRPDRCGIDLLTVSAHKIYGPKGAGFLYVRDGVRIEPVIFGGGQQNGLRSGTLNTPGIAGLKAAASEAYSNLERNNEKLFLLKQRLVEGLCELDGVSINGPGVFEGAPHIVSATFSGIRAEVLLHALEDEGIYVSAGAACSSSHPEENRTLYEIGLRKDALSSTVRLSLGIYNTQEEIDRTLDVLKAALPGLRKFVRR